MPIFSEAVNVNEFFPLEFKQHLIFGIIGVVFFLFQYYRLRRHYQIYMALGIGATFLLYLGKSMHNIIGAVEAVLMALVVISLVKDAVNEKKKKKAEESSDTDEKNSNTDTDSENDETDSDESDDEISENASNDTE